MTNEFLSAVLPTEGLYCVFVTDGNKLRKNVFVDNLDALLRTAQDFDSQSLSAYMAMASYDDAGRRKAENAQMMRSLFMDLDCGEGKDFKSKRDAVERLQRFLEDTGLDKLGCPWLVDSGGGVHVHMPFHTDIPVADWVPLAEAMKNAAVQHSFPMDMSVSADAARVLRIPGLHNFKTGTPRPVVLRMQGAHYAVEEVSEVLEKYKVALFKPKTAIMIPGTAPSMQVSAIAKAMAGNRITWFKTIAQKTKAGTGCNQIAYYVANAQDDGMEPLWRACLSVAKFCEDGEKAATWLSNLHPYDENRMRQKLSDIVGPYTCAKFESHNPGHCAGCQHLGKINSPITLGVAMDTVTERVVEEETPEGEKVQRHLPTPPRGFAYARNGGVVYIKDGEDDDRKEVMLTTYDLYVQGIFFEANKRAYSYSLVAEKEGETVTFALPSEAIGDGKSLVKLLARNNIFAVGGAHHDMYLANYVRACMTDASMNKRYVIVPSNLGWQKDGSFAVGCTVLSPQGAKYDYTFRSDDLQNVMEATQTKGTFSNWRKVADMVVRKAQRDPIFVGHCALMYSNFAAPLMRFGPDGAKACAIHACSKGSGVGKTFSSALNNSVFGAPEGMKVAARTSENTLLQRAGLLGTIVLHVDEVTTQNRRSEGEYLPEFLYNYSMGTLKVKGAANGNVEIAHNCSWTGFAHLSSNEPQAEALMGARRHTSHGEVQRFIEWQIPASYKLTWTEEERAIKDLLKDNYGTAGRKYMRWLLDNMDVAEEVYRKVEQRWRVIANAQDNERFWTNSAVSHLTAVILCSSAYADIVDGPYEEIEKWWVERITSMRRVISNNITTAIDILNAYTREYSHSFIYDDRTIAPTLGGLLKPQLPIRGAVRGRVEKEVTPGVTDFFIEISMLKRHCAHLGVSYVEFAKELATVPGLSLRECVRNILKGTPGPGLRAKCLQITRSTADVEADEALAAAQ